MVGYKSKAAHVLTAWNISDLIKSIFVKVSAHRYKKKYRNWYFIYMNKGLEIKLSLQQHKTDRIYYSMSFGSTISNFHLKYQFHECTY